MLVMSIFIPENRLAHALTLNLAGGEKFEKIACLAPLLLPEKGWK